MMLTHPAEPYGPGLVRHYEFRVRGHLSPALLACFEGLESSLEPVQTVLRGPLADQAALHDVIEQINALGLELLELRRLPRAPWTPEPRPRGDTLGRPADNSSELSEAPRRPPP